MKRKPATRVFQHFPRWRSGHAEPMRRSVGTRPRSETTRTRGQRKENAIRVDSRLRASRRLACRLKRALPAWAYSRWNISYIQTQRYTKSKYILYVRQLVSVEI